MARRSSQQLIDLLKSKPMVELGEMQAALGNASRTTVFRYLESIPYRSSYNYNGRYYTFYDATKFGPRGLYSAGGMYFSSDGTLKATAVRLVHKSEAGQTHRELQELLRVRVQLFLQAALREGSIDRELVEKVYIYLHSDPGVRADQLRHRQERVAESASSAVIDHEVIIRVLLVMIRYPGSRPGDVVRRLRGHSPPVEPVQVDHVFSQYGLGEKGGPRIY